MLKFFSRIERVEQKQIETDSKLEQIFSAIESKEIKPKQGIFFEGQIFDAYKLLTNIVKSAENSIYIIDNFIDETKKVFWWATRGEGLNEFLFWLF